LALWRACDDGGVDRFFKKVAIITGAVGIENAKYYNANLK
jgi:hypothetical protein